MFTTRGAIVCKNGHLFKDYCQLSCKRFFRSPAALWGNENDKNGDDDNKTALESNPFYSKYADRITCLRLENRSNNNCKTTIDKVAFDETGFREQYHNLEKKLSKVIGTSSETGSQVVGKRKSLNSIMYVDKIKDKSKEEISEIWTQYHQQRDAICAVIPGDAYERIAKRSAKCPLFIYPLPRNEGVEFVFAQFNGDDCHFTPLAGMKTFGELSPPILTISHYKDFHESKGLVLMSGVWDSNQLKSTDAQLLANQLQFFYALEDESRFELVKTFNHFPENFQYENLLNALSSLGYHKQSSS